MSEKLWIGIDGGGTKTTAVIGDESGHLLAVVKGSSGNLTAISTEQLYTLINELINQLLIKTGAAFTDVEMVYAAMAGADRQAEQQKIYDAFKQSTVLEKLKIQSDIHAALAAGTWGREGTLLIAGTGAIIFGYEQQKTFRVGGWGYLLGDEGSGYHLGKLAIRSVLKAHDDKVPLKPFQEKILTHFNVLSPDQLITKIYGSSNPITAISSVSMIVLDAFEEELSKFIVSAVQEALLELIESAYSRIDRTKPVVFHGGLFSNNTFYEAFTLRFSSRFPDLIALKPTISGTVGAYLLALHESKVEVSDPVKQTIQQTWRLLEGEIT
ncbi:MULTISPECIES: N-acetylglucosamine kinase [unclassified Solibacillus]|uniref:N-acetylglucosamine kinase n=1 Tax=unclassified Solibacillus TaxID=2637870 RepID=UPI0030FB25F4